MSAKYLYFYIYMSYKVDYVSNKRLQSSEKNVSNLKHNKSKIYEIYMDIIMNVYNAKIQPMGKKPYLYKAGWNTQVTN